MTRLIAVVMVLAAAVPAAGQTSQVPQAGRFEIDAGGGWIGGTGLGSLDANMRAATASPTSFRLFSVDGRFGAAPTFHVKAGFALNRRLGIEGGLTLSRPELRASVSNDSEAAPPITITERIDQYSVDAGVIFMIGELAVGRRTLPFVSAGAGYLRQLHEGQTIVEQGQVFHAGGGVKHWLMTRNRGVRGVGLRADGRLYFMSGGITFEEDSPRPHGAISGSVFLSF